MPQGFRPLLKHLLGPRPYPAGFAWFLEGPWRRWVLSPEELARRLGLPKAVQVCELGVGGGYYARSLALAVRSFLGLDLQRAMLARARTRSSPSAILLVQADATHLPLRAASFDIVVAVTVLGEVPSAEATIAEVARVLRPGGLFSVSEHLPDPDFQPLRRVSELCDRCGLRLERHYGQPWAYTANYRLSNAA